LYIAVEKYFNFELNTTVAHHENLVAEDFLGVRVPLYFGFAFRLNENNLRNFLQSNRLINTKDLHIEFMTISLSESIQMLNWNTSHFHLVAWFGQFYELAATSVSNSGQNFKTRVSGNWEKIPGKTRFFRVLK